MLETSSSRGNMPSSIGALTEPPLHHSSIPVYFFSAGFDTGADIGIAAPFGFWKKRWFVYITESPPPFSLHACKLR